MTATIETATADLAAMRAALADADIVPTLMVLAHLGAGADLLEEAAPHIQGAWSFMENVPEALRERIRDRLVATLDDYRRNGRALPRQIEPELLRKMMNTAVGQTVGEDYIPLLLEEMRLSEDTRQVNWRGQPPAGRNDFRVVVIGAGFSGLCAAVALRQLDIPFVVIEKNDEVGGTWYENDYPGCGVDTPNHFFSYSFYPYNKWTHHFSKRDEIQGYIEEVARVYELKRDIRFRTEVTEAGYDEASGEWIVTLRKPDGGSETLRCNAVITAVGQLNRPAVPHIPGLDSFTGPAFHTAAWNHRANLRGKRVVMIGTGASAMQAAPAIAPDVAHLTVVQRTPHWAMPNVNYHRAVTEGQRWALDNIPFFSEWCRFQLFWASSDGFHPTLQVDPEWTQPARSLNAANHKMREMLEAHIRKELEGDEDLIAKCTPSYPPYGKRMLRDNHWYRMLKRPNVSLLSGGVARIEGDSVVMEDGERIAADAIILATGFQASKILWPMEIKGRGGVSIRERWGNDDPRAYKGMTVPDFPNLFVTFGPNTNLAHGGSAIFHFECQIRYIMQALRELIETGQRTTEIRRDVHDAYNRLVDEKCSKMVWAHPGVTNWYKNKQNRVTLTSPWRLLDYWALTARFEPDEYRFDMEPQAGADTPAKLRAAG